MSKKMQKQAVNKYGVNHDILLHLLILLLLLSFFAADSGYAFYRQESTGKGIEIDSKQSSSISGKNKLGIYHSINKLASENHNRNFLHPVLKEFVAADTIDIAFPVKYDLHSVSSIDMELSNVMYANLKFKALVNAYTELNKSAAKVEKNKYVLPLSGIGLNNRPQRFRAKSIHQKWKSILDAQRTVLKKTKLNFSNYSNKIKPLKEINSKSLPVLMGRLETTEIKQKRLFDRPNSVSTNNNREFGISNGNLDADKESNGNATMERQRQRTVDESQLPWIIRAVSSLIKYCYENKIEALVYGIILMFVVSIFTGSRTR